MKPALSSASRREFVTGAAGLFALVGCGKDEPLGLDDTGTYLVTATGDPNTRCPDPLAGGTFLEAVRWDDPSSNPVGVLYNEGWDARRRYDLGRLADGELETPNELFYVRTEYPDLLTTAPDGWTVRIEGLVDAPADVPIADIRSRAVDQGSLLLECSGNGGDFGLMSTARWGGAPILSLIDAFATRHPAATRVLVRGFDQHSVPSANGHSDPGAEWIFTFEELADAFLATEMGGLPLPPDNGAPVRLLVPGWYGCACIKWVTHLELVDDSARATSQMMEFASRTHQEGVPELARDYAPASQGISATPVRVEKWELDGRIVYRVVGILWGGSELVSGLRLHAGAQNIAVECFAHLDNRVWNLWSARWEPTRSGRFDLSNSVDEDVPQIRLDLGWYDRSVTLDEPAG